MKQLQCLCFYLFSKDYRYVNITELLILFIHLARLCVLFFPSFAQLALCPFFSEQFQYFLSIIFLPFLLLYSCRGNCSSSFNISFHCPFR